MLTVYDNTTPHTISNDEYYVRELASGYDEVVFEVDIRDPIYQYIREEARITDRDQNEYVIKQIDAGEERAKVVAQINLDDWKGTLYFDYSNNSATVGQTVSGICPTGWSVLDSSLSVKRRTIPSSDTTTEFNVTALEILEECVSTYSVRFRFNTKNKVVTIIDPKNYTQGMAFASRDLNLRQLNYKGKSDSFVTRLYAVGAEGLTFESINGGKKYVDNFTYSDKIICGYWQDERYTDKQSLLEDARAKLAEMAIPQISYECDVLDLANTNPDMYGFEDFSLFQIIALVDDAKGTIVPHQVVETWSYPYYPEKNKIVLSTKTPNIQTAITAVSNAVSSTTSTFQQIMQAAIQNATNLITGNRGGYVVFHDSDGDGLPDEILIMNTPDISTATKVWRWNSSGLGYSKTGYNGNYGLAMTIDGAIVANYITTGVLNAGIIKAGLLQDFAGVNYWNMETGDFVMSSTAKVGNSPVASAATVSTAVDNYDTDLNQAKVFNKLTDNGALQGLYMQNGELYINGTYIKTGVLDADLVTAGTLSDKYGYNSWNLDTGAFKLSSNTTVGSGTAKVASETTVSSAIDDYDEDLNQKAVFDKLTQGGTKEGITLDAQTGQLYINATYIATGILTDAQGKFALNMRTGELHMKDGSFEGSISGSLFTTAPSNNPTTARIEMDTSSSIKGVNGSTTHNIINMEQVVSGSNQMTIDADTQLNIRTRNLYVTDQSAGEGTAIVYKTVTNNARGEHDDNPDYYLIKNLGKYGANNPPPWAGAFPPRESWIKAISEDDADEEWDIYCTLPVYLRFEKQPLRYINGMLVSGGETESVII